MTKLERLFLDQKLFGFFCKLIGQYNFRTEKVGLAQYEVTFENKHDISNLLSKVNLLKNKELVMSFNISETLNFKTLCFEVSDENQFDFLNFCITFKFFYQYIKQNTNYGHLILKTTRYKSYMYRTLFGFSMAGWDNDHFYLDFNMQHGLQNIWEEYYGTSLEENLYNFILPVDAGGFVPGNIKLKRPNTAATALVDFKKTEKRFYHCEQPQAEIKIGYQIYRISIRDLSEKGLAFVYNPTDEHPQLSDIQMNHIYNVWINDAHLNMNWSNLSVQILWQNDNTFGCRIRENSAAWKQFIRFMDVKDYERITFIDRV